VKDALLEIGVEPLPSRFIAPALAELEGRAKTLLEEARLPARSVRAYGTFRRLAVLIEGLPQASEPLSLRVLGPPARLLKDASGRFTPQAEGFARAQGITPDRLLTAWARERFGPHAGYAQQLLFHSERRGSREVKTETTDLIPCFPNPSDQPIELSQPSGRQGTDSLPS